MAEQYDPRHPHEPGIPPALDDEGRCLVCCLLVQRDEARAEVERLKDKAAGAEMWKAQAEDAYAEAERLKRLLDQRGRDAADAEDQAERLREDAIYESERKDKWKQRASDYAAEAERLREAIKKAPHAKHCGAASPMWPGACDCWKATALSREDSGHA